MPKPPRKPRGLIERLAKEDKKLRNGVEEFGKLASTNFSKARINKKKKNKK